MDRYWLLTWTTYGTWLPGDDRGFVSNIKGEEGKGTRENQPHTPYAKKQRGLAVSARENLLGPPVWLLAPHSQVIAAQFHETAQYRNWQLLAFAVMGNHCHIVIGVPGDPEPEVLLRDLKSYASRALNKSFGRPASGTWWTESASRRKLPDEYAVKAAVRYVQHQDRPLLIWTREDI